VDKLDWRSTMSSVRRTKKGTSIVRVVASTGGGAAGAGEIVERHAVLSIRVRLTLGGSGGGHTTSAKEILSERSEAHPKRRRASGNTA
jgi:hypothetical protein